jgi:hypothetical protein
MSDKTEFARFDSLLRKLVAVPKKEIAEKEREYKKERKKIRRRRREKR